MKEGDVYIKRLKSGNDAVRRIIAIHKGVVCYSRGTDTNGFCSEQEFLDWAANGRVEIAEGKLLDALNEMQTKVS